MGRGLGAAQRAILEAVQSESFTTARLAALLDRSHIQIRNTTDSLHARGLVRIKRGHIGTRPDGMPLYGRVVSRADAPGRLIKVSAEETTEVVKRWHYSGAASHGVARHGWEVDGRLVGISIYDTGTRPMRQGVFGPKHYRRVLNHHRLALTDDAPRFTASQFIGASLKQLRRERPELWAVVTYADLCQGHDGVIYRATNAVETGVVGRGNLHLQDAQGRIQVTQSLSGTWPERRQEARRRGWTESRCLGKARYVWLPGSARFKRRPVADLRWV
ncbi:hypothetical protein QE418_000137 [Microbacterium testaceum]|nr:hypothetical protein [Microbacterium testaceum]MDR6098764.1 hypothetical protein [Microbacterium sp. SORGH_AS_0454]